MTRTVELSSPLGRALEFGRASLSEALSQPFELRLEVTSRRADIRPEELLGQRIGLKMRIDAEHDRYLHGYCAEFSLAQAREGRASYALVVRPWTWFLTLRTDCRLYQRRSVLDVVEDVLGRAKGLGTYEIRVASRARYRAWDGPWDGMNVQFRESDFNFVSRLLEQEGLYYFFEHDSSDHVLVIADDRSAHRPPAGQPKWRFVDDLGGAVARADAVTGWSFQQEVVSGAVALGDYDFRRPATVLRARRRPPSPPGHPLDDLEAYDFPGDFDDAAEGDQYAGLRIDALHAEAQLYRGSAFTRRLTAGHLLRLEGHPRKDLNGEFLVLSTDFSIQDLGTESGAISSSDTECSFLAMRADRQYRPARRTPRPAVQGTLIGVVCGPEGEEIHTDRFGRVKVRFPWDRHGKGDATASGWIRVASPWANSGFGFFAVPRIGSEVLVTFVDGDPDRPIVTGCVYNGDNPPPYACASTPEVSGLRSRSSKGAAADNFNELRFDDTRGKELVFLQAERDWQVRVRNDRLLHVARDDHASIGGARYASTAKDDHLGVGGDRVLDVKGALHARSGQGAFVKAGQQIALDAGTEVHVKAGTKLVLEASSTITLKVGGNFVSIGPQGIDIKGSMIRINSGGAAQSGSGVKVRAAREPSRVPVPAAVAGRPARPEPVAAGPTAVTMKTAAASHAPFSEKCKGC